MVGLSALRYADRRSCRRLDQWRISLVVDGLGRTRVGRGRYGVVMAPMIGMGVIVFRLLDHHGLLECSTIDG